jgi:hypothetical protein
MTDWMLYASGIDNVPKVDVFMLVHLLKELAFTAGSCIIIIKIFLSLALPGKTQKRLTLASTGLFLCLWGVLMSLARPLYVHLSA